MKLLFIPHVGNGGGAALYNKQFLSSIVQVEAFEIEVWGRYHGDYDFGEKKYGMLDFSKVCFPYYEGVSFFAQLYWFFVSFFSVFSIVWKLRKYDFSGKTIVLSSSILLPWAFLIKKRCESCRVVILVQENWRLDGVFGFASKFLLNYVDVVVSITRVWAEKAKSYGVNSFLYPNLYLNPKEILLEGRKDFDFIYLGGGSKIKGYNDFLCFCKLVSSRKDVSVLALGEYTKEQVYALNSIFKHNANSKVVVIGYVNDPMIYIKKSKVLLLPIQSPHFCRPAIEAGFFYIPFVIKKHNERQDFIDGNCLEYSTVSEMVDMALMLVNDESLRTKMGMINHCISMRFTDDGTKAKELRRVILYG